MSGIIYKGDFKENTDYICVKCNNPVWEINEPKYAWECYGCESKFEYDDVLEQSPYYHSPVWVCFKQDGKFEFLLNSDGERINFKTQIEAECYLLENEFSCKDL